MPSYCWHCYRTLAVHKFRNWAKFRDCTAVHFTLPLLPLLHSFASGSCASTGCGRGARGCRSQQQRAHPWRRGRRNATGTEGGGGLGLTGVAEERGGEARRRPARRRSETRSGDGDEWYGSPKNLGSLAAW